ncbi:MAG: hypothetical protein GY703_25335 [Gammaproteobacteria bacterium]|nr:hypothetical protein [Gammaproteobacteria bacterium]
MNNPILVVAMAALLSACESEPQAIFGFQDEGMGRYVVKGLEERGIWYRSEREGRIIMYRKDLPIVEIIGAEFGERTIPFGRSTAMPLT